MKTKILTALILLLVLSCNKDDDTNEFTPTLPAITQEGKNTFGCYINGVLLTPRDGTGTFNSPDHGMIFWGSPTNYNYYEIDIRDYKSESGALMNIHILNLSEVQENIYVLNESNCEDNVDSNINNNIYCRILDQQTQTYKWYCSIENGGILNITRYDFDNRIVSGTFNCTVQNRDNPEETIEITEGRFDIKWDILSETIFP
jgi:hypothetical protein